MKKMWKRFVSLLLACTLLAGMLPLSASAAGKPGEGSEQYKYAESILNKLNESITNEQEKYGLYGPALLADSELYTYSLQRSIYDEDSGKWTTDTQYILVPGVDAQNTTTPNYNGLNSGQPWAESNPSAIYIAEGVTGIGNYAFASQPSLNNVVFQDASDLTYIGQRAFYDDDNAVFTDEGSEDETTLNLSNVNKMGEYAFYNCDEIKGVELNGNIIAVETPEGGGSTQEIPNKIPNHAFNNSGLQTVNIPEGIVTIGDGAFGHTSLSKVGELVLPSGLQTIGDNAFVVTMGSGETGIGITSLTIPSSVNSIGANAFSGRRNLAEVTVEDDNVSNTQLTLGNAAFGFNESSAFSEWGSITDDRTGQKYEGTMGTKFYLPADLTEKFINGTNCYTGDIEPMKWVKTQQPTCDTDGYHLYETTKKGAYDDEGKPLVLQYKYTIPMLGHDYQLKKSFSATCETNSYELWVCTRDETHTENRKIGEVSKPKGHNYQLTQVDDTEMGGGNDTTFTWVCQTKEHDDTRDSLDKTLEITIEPATIQANTSMTVGDLADMMPQVDGGKLSLAEDEKLDAALTTDTKPVRVVFTPDEVKYADYTNVGAVSEFNNADLTLEVNVSKAKLDFSSVRFGNCLVGINPGEEVNVPITIERGNLPEDVKAGAPVYTEHGNKEGSTTPPSIGKSWTGTVSVTFTYDPKKYEEETKNLPAEYTYSQDPEAGTVKITHSYVVTKLEMTNVSATAIPDLEYTGSPMETVHVYGIPAGSTVFWEWVSTTDSSVTSMGSAENGNSPNLQIAEITNAGTYEVTITITNKSYETYTLPSPVTVTIQKAKIETPKPQKDLVYTSHKLIGLASPDANAKYSYQEGSKLVGVNAGTYTAMAVLTDTANYEWTESDDDGDGAVTISWNIAKRPVIETSIGNAYKDQTTPFTGNPITAVSPPSSTSSGFFDVTYDDEGNLVGKIKGTETVAFKISHAQETNAETYTVIASIEDFANFCWQNHPDDEDVTLGTWTIGKLQIYPPTIAAPDATYDGVPYDGEVTLKHSSVSGSNGSSEGIIDLNETNILYYTQPTGGTGGSAPVNAGTYFAGVESNGWAFVDGKLATNYQILGGSRAPFSISKAIATMEFSQKEVSATYTAQGTDLQQVTVDGLVDADKDKPASDVYTVTYTYKYRNDNTDWEEVKTETTIEEPSSFKFTDVGEYQITATFSSQNYTAADATYTLTITQANDQKITLTSAETNAGKWDVENNSYTTIYGSEKTFTVTGKAALDKENADISYAVNGDSNVVSVDGSSGVVTIHKAGTATITVTAADTDNVTGTSVNYTVTVNRAKPTVNTGLPDDELTVAYTGEAITDTEYNKATATANVVKGADQPTGDITYTFYADQECKNKVTNGGGEENNIPIAVGTYYMKATYPGDKNYLPAESKVVTVTVTKAQLTVDAEGHTGTYDGKTHDAITVNSVTGNSEEITGYTVKYAVTNNDTAPNENAGEEVWKGTLPVKDVADSTSENLYYWYMVTADNYNPAIGEVEVKIAPAPLTVAGEPTHYTKEYDGDKTVDETFDEITVTAKDVPEVTIDVDATGTYDNENAGKDKNVTLTLTLSGVETWGNYSYNGAAPTDGKITLTKDDAGTITPKAITVTGISAVDRVYDGTKVVQLTGMPETTDKVGEDDLTLIPANDATGSIADANVGKDKAVTVETSVITLDGTDKDNYTVKEVKYDASNGLTVNIDQRPVNLEFAGIGQDDRIIEKAYTGQPVSVTVGPVTNPDEGTGFVDSDQLKADDVDYTYTPVDPTTDKNHTAVGSYTVTAALKGTSTGNYGNYELKFPAEATLKITPAEMVVTAKNYTGTYTGKAHDVTASWTAKTTGSASTEIEITKVEFIKKTDDTKPKADAEGWSEISFINVAQSGEYWYKVTAENYAPIVGGSAVTITINPATLTLSSSLTKEKGYDGTTVAVVTGQKVTGAQNGENITVPSVSAAYDNANVGTGKTITTTYTVTFDDGVTPGNYTYTGNVEGKATSTWTIKTTVEDGKITQAPVTVTISDQTSVYDGEKPTVGQEEGTKEDPKAWYVSTGEVFSQDTTKDNLGITLSIAPDSKDADTYAITGEWTNKNYDVIFTGSWKGEEHKSEAGTYTITPRPIDVKIGNAEGFYGDAPVLKGVELTYEQTGDNRGLASGETSVSGIQLGTGANKESPVAEYTIYAVNGDNQVGLNTPEVIGNYNVTFTNEGTYTVNPRPITITIKDHRSKYGAAIDGGIAKPLSGKDYTVAITAGNTVTGGAIVNGDDLGIALFTTAKKGDNAGTYSISGEAKAESSVVSNYAITWKGQTPYQGQMQQATYTVEKAELTVEAKQTAVYAQYGQETANPLTFTNASTGEEITVDDSNYETLENAVTYTLNPPGSLTMETENKAEGKFTVNVTDTTVTVEVNVAETDNFKAATMIAYDVYTSASGSLTVDLPFADLTYTSEEQKLLTGAPTLPADVVIRYKLGGKGTWTKYSDEAPNNWQSLVGTGAGDYTVYWETKAGGNYNASSGHETTEIKKADLSATYTGLNDSEVTLVLSEMRDTYTIPLDLTGNKGYTHSNGDGVTFLSGNTDVAIAKNSTATLELRGVAGEAKITINCPGDNNYNPGTFTFTVKVTDQKAEIKYNITGATTIYNGQPQTIEVKVTQPASGATVMYWNEKTSAYDLFEPPAYTDVKDSGTTIKFQITAPGYNTVTGEATLTINPKPIKENMIAGIAESYTYTGKGITFDDAISVHDEGVLLEKDKDYTITYDDNKEVGQGSVTITGRGNYKGSVTKNFTISPVDASDLTASLNRTFGYYGDSYTNNATVTVTHGSHTVTSDGSNTVSIAVKDNTGTDVTNQSDVVSINDHQTVTFNQVGTYTIEVTVTGNHETNAPIQLTYALLPVEEGKLVLKADNETSVVETYGDTVNGTITVTDVNGTPMTENTDYTLAYTYTPFEGTAQGSKPYDPSVMSGTPAAGMYVVTATGQGGYANSVGTFTFLILQRDLADAILDVDDADLVFNHDEKRPSVTVTVDGNAQPTKDADYTITYYNSVNASNAAKAVVTATGNNFTGSKTEDFTIAPKPITECVVKDIPDQYYTGNEVIPPVTITDGNYTLILGYDYTTACDAIGPGTATVTITGTGNYTETTTKDFVIKSEGAPEPSERFDLAVTPSQWIWKDDLTNLRLSVTFGTGNELDLGTEYTLEVNGQTFNGTTGKTKDDALAYIKSLKPGEYTITATGVGAYNGSTDTETVTIQKIQPEVTVTATPNSLSGGGKVTLTLKGEKLPDGMDLKNLLKVTAKNDSDVTLEDLHIQWPQDGSLTAELTLPNTNETYTFTLSFVGNDYYESASSTAMVVVGQQTSGGGGGSDPGDQPADPDDTGVSDWLNTKEHLAYLAGYPGGTFGPDQNMTRAEAAQMFYNLLLEKDVEITVEFEDVPADAWYAKPVNTLASLGILSGVGNGRFDPERSITRAEFTVIAMKFANTSGGGVNIFSDVNEDDWFYSAVVDSTQYGWINGYPDGTFRPEATISRAEVTVIVNHMLGRAADRPYVIAHEEELNTFGDVNRGHWGYFHVAEATNAHEYHTEDGTESWTGLS